MHSEIARYEPWIEILGRQIGHLEAMPGFHQAGTDLGRNAVGQRLRLRMGGDDQSIHDITPLAD